MNYLLELGVPEWIAQEIVKKASNPDGKIDPIFDGDRGYYFAAPYSEHALAKLAFIQRKTRKFLSLVGFEPSWYEDLNCMGGILVIMSVPGCVSDCFELLMAGRSRTERLAG